MSATAKSDAEDAIERMNLGAANRLLAGYWLSLWDGDALPRRERFDPARVSSLMSSLLLFDVVPDNEVTVRMAGSDVERLSGRDFNGCDWVAAAPTRLRGMRVRNLTAVARGAVLSARRRMRMSIGSDRFNEELVLPFAANDDGLCPVVAYADWQLDPATTRGVPLVIEHCAREHRLIAFGDKKKVGDLSMPAV
jgi:hypothetical protein